MGQSSLFPPRTYRLKTFGTLTLTAEASQGLSQQRRRLALLVVLAASGEGGLTRDQLLAYLWPESAEANARHSLEQLVHATRRALGETVFKGVNPLSLNSEVVASDVMEFEQALSRGDLAGAVALYRGPFLSGFFLEDAPEFERWTESERSRLAHQYAEALRRLAGDAEKAGDHAAAIGWWRRLVEADPVSSRSALSLMRAFVASGDRAAALQHARVHEELVRQELESEPDPSITTYIASLRVAGGEPPATVREMSAPRDSLRTVLPPSAPPLSQAAPNSEHPAFTEASVGQTRVRRLAWTALGVAILPLAAWFGWPRENAPALDPNKLVILPFSITGGDSSQRNLGEGVAVLLAPMLTGEGGPLAVDSRTAISTWNRVGEGRDGTSDVARDVARTVGAGKALFGTLLLESGRLTLTASMVDAANGDARPLTPVNGPVDSVQSVLDGLLTQILVRHAVVHERTVGALTSQSLPALRAYLDGYHAYQQSHIVEAIRDFDRALDLDSTFALAALQLATATAKLLRQPVPSGDAGCLNLRSPGSNVCRYISTQPGLRDVAGTPGDDARFDRGIRLAWQSRSKLGSRDLPLLEALRGRNFPRPSTGSETYLDLVRAAEAAPDRAETQYLLGLIMLYQGPAIGHSNALAQAEALFRGAQSLDSAYLPPLARLVDVAGYEANAAKLRRYGTQYLARDSAGATADYVRWRVAVGTGDGRAARQIRARFAYMDLSALNQIITASQMSGVAVDDADSAAILIISRATDRRDRAGALYRGNSIALNRGRPRQAHSLLRLRREIDSAQFGFWQSTTLAALFADGDSAEAATSARERAQWLGSDTVRWTATPPDSIPVATRIQAWQQALWDWTHGRMAESTALVSWLRRHGSADLADVGEMLTATSAGRSDAPALRARIDSAARRGCCRAPHQIDLVLASAYELAGSDSAALAVLRRGRWIIGPDFLAIHLVREGRLAARLGDRAGAIRAYEHYLALRANPEAPLRANRDSIQAEVNRLKRGR